jgi:hypothetical protein
MKHKKKISKHIISEDESTLEQSAVIDRLFETWHNLRFEVIPAASIKIAFSAVDGRVISFVVRSIEIGGKYCFHLQEKILH